MLILLNMEWIQGLYRLLTLEPLHNFNMGISELLKECPTTFLDSNMEFTDKMYLCRSKRAVQSMRTSSLKATNSMLAEIEDMYRASKLPVYFSKKETSHQQNGLFISDGLQGMLEGKHYRFLDIVFLFVAAFLDRRIGMPETPMLTTVHILFSTRLTSCRWVPEGCLGWKLSSMF